MNVTALPGFRDAFPDALARRRHIFAVWREVAARYGFEEYDGPPLEPLELYTRKSGEEIVEQLYCFTDKGGREVTLRPEMTPTLARMVAQHAARLKKPIRWFSLPQLFRYERQQRGRLREHFQLNMDIIGEAGPLADAEVIGAAVDIVRALGFGPGDVRARVSDRRVLSDALTGELGVTAELVPATLAALDKFERAPEATREALEKAFGAGKGTSTADAVLAFAARLEDPAAPAGASGRGAAARVPRSPARDGPRGVRGRGFPHRPRPGLLHGRRVRAVRRQALPARHLRRRALRRSAQAGRRRGPALRGLRDGGRRPGRADGGARRAAARPEPVVAVFVAMVSEDDRPAALALAHALRDRGIRVEFALKKQALGKQLELAAARGARAAVVLGPEERAAGQAVVRTLATGRRAPGASLAELAKDYAF